MIFKCPQCDYCTVYKCNLVRHQKTHNKSALTVSSEENRCSFCQKIFAHAGNRVRHEKTCSKGPSGTTTASSAPINQFIQNNTVNIIQVHTNGIKPPMVFKFEENPDEPLDFHLDHMMKGNKRYSGLKEALRHLFEDPHNLPMRKMDERSPYSEVHIGDDKWEKAIDHEITPLFLYQSLNAIQDADILKQTKILDEHIEIITPVLESIMQSPEYQDESDQREQNKHRKYLKMLYQVVKLYMIEKGKEYKRLVTQ